MDQLRQVDLGGGGKAYYVYGSSGQRIRKVIERNANTRIERIYLGTVEIYREWTNNVIKFERKTVHISDNTGRIAQVDTKTKDDDNSDPANPLNSQLIRYQYGNHLGSATLETNADGEVISYEEYHPYGTSAYRSAKPGFDLSLKRYRFSGKERDDETGLYYFGARFYAPWLGRWTSSDPAGFVDGINLLKYCSNNPINQKDLYGLDGIAISGKPDEIRRAQVDPSEASGRIYEAWVRRQTLSIDGQEYAVSGGTLTWSENHWWIPDAQLVPINPSSNSSTEQEADLEVTVTPDSSQPPAASPSPSEVPETNPSLDTSDEPPESEQAAVEQNGNHSENRSDSSNGSPDSNNESLLDRIPHPNAGASTVTTWDSVQRAKYTAGNAARSAQAVSRVRAATQANDAVRAWETAREASEARNAARVATQGRLSPGGRAMSQAIDAGRTFESSVAEYATRAPGGRTPSPTRYAYTIAERVAEGSGRSNPWMSRLARGGRILGPVGIVVGLGFAGRNIYNAPPDQRGRVAAGESGNFLGGMLGASLGMSAGVALAGGVSGFLIGLGVIAGPIGWLAIGLGILGGIIGAWVFSNLGRATGEVLYE